MIRLLLVDDQSLIRRGMKALLKADDELQVVGEAENGQEAIRFIQQAYATSTTESLQPDVVLMDIRMPIMDGVAATREICQTFPQIKVLVLTTFDDDEYVAQAIRNGASGYLLKDTPFDELVQAIRFVYRGYMQIGPGLGSKVIADPPAVISQPRGFPELTSRELEILRLIAQGASNREIADTLFISEKTVRNHVTNILSRLNVRDRTQAAIVALQNGWFL
ncbi:response regulator [Leptothermofonsia sp. ETS-13]|uniref:response regulator n=1 Tax=Leptothermofonsia sp. ETS-13 TaxID=3035696 RepID=UPI003BA14CDB